MNVAGNVDLISVLGLVIIGLIGLTGGIFAWLGQQLYIKLTAIEELMRNSVSHFAERAGAVEGRVLRLEAKMDSMETDCRAVKLAMGRRTYDHTTPHPHYFDPEPEG